MFQDDYKSFLKDQPYESTQSPEVASPSNSIDFQNDFARITQEQPDISQGIDSAILQQTKQYEKQQQQAQLDIEQALEAYKNTRFEPPAIEEYAQAITTKNEPGSATFQKTILGSPGIITQKFGNRSSVEKYSGGVNYGTDIAVKKGTNAAVPPGSWEVIESFDKATAEGANNKQGGINRGYGNSVLVKNTETGEKLRFSHLSKVFVRPGQKIDGGTIIGKTGATGNVAGRTGQHLDIEYYNASGRLQDILKTKYGRYLLGV